MPPPARLQPVTISISPLGAAVPSNSVNVEETPTASPLWRNVKDSVWIPNASMDRPIE